MDIFTSSIKSTEKVKGCEDTNTSGIDRDGRDTTEIRERIIKKNQWAQEIKYL